MENDDFGIRAKPVVIELFSGWGSDEPRMVARAEPADGDHIEVFTALGSPDDCARWARARVVEYFRGNDIQGGASNDQMNVAVEDAPGSLLAVMVGRGDLWRPVEPRRVVWVQVTGKP